MTNLPAQTSLSGATHSRSLAVAVLLALFVHIPILFSDTVLWDSTLIKQVHNTKEFEAFRRRGSMEGNTPVTYFHIAMGHIPKGWTIYRVISFCCYGLGAYGIYRVLRACPLFSADEAALISGMSMTFPSLVLWQEPILTGQGLCFAVFWCAAAARLRQIQNGSATIFAHGITSAAFFYSFLTESLLVFYFVLYLYFFLILCSEWTRRRLIGFIASNAWYLALPFVFYIWKHFALQAHGRYSDYNSLQLSNMPFLVAKGIVGNVKRMVFDQLVDIAAFSRNEPVFFLELATVAAIISATACFLLCLNDDRRPSFRTAALAIAFAMLAYAAAVFPYAAVNKFPQLDRYFARHAVLIYVPISTAFVILLKYLFPGRVRKYVAALALGLLVMQTLRSEIQLQNQFIKVSGIIENLRGQDANLADVVVFDDRTKLGTRDALNTYELGWMTYEALNNRRHLSFERTEVTPSSISTWDAKDDHKEIFYRDYQFDGTASRVVVSLAEPKNELASYLSYLSKSGADRKDYARSLIRLRIDPPLPWDEIVAESPVKSRPLEKAGR